MLAENSHWIAVSLKLFEQGRTALVYFIEQPFQLTETSGGMDPVAEAIVVS
jgi:hypothetical protein